MTKRLRQTIVLALAGTAIAVPAGCGDSDDPEGAGLPQETSDALVRELDLAEERLRVTREDRKVGACQDIESKSYPAIEALVSQIPDDTDPQVREALESSISRLRELSAAECDDLTREIEQEESETDPLPTPETTPETTPEETTTETAPEEAPEEKKDKKDKGDEDGGGAEPDPVDPTAPGQGGGAVPGAGEEG